MEFQDVKIPWEGWRVINKIGKGGFGTVYEIERSQYGIQERAAMKVITIPQSADEIDDLLIEGYDNNSITQRFDSFAEDIVREYGMMAQMKGNANIVYCDDYRIIQQDNGFGRDIYIKMELLTPLLKAMDRVSSESQIIRFGMEMCNALEACQKRKVIHRDIKPQNIFVSDDGAFKLGDFGIARKAEKTTRATVGKGTYQFMAPEVKNEQPYGPTVDMYSLGLVMYWLLNNRRCPFFPLPPAVPTHKEEQEALRRRFSGEKIPAPKNGSEELKRIVLKACAFDPKDRYTSAAAMLDDLNKLTGGMKPITPVVIPEEDTEEAKTTGPLFEKTNVSKPDTARADDFDKTVGPYFVVKAPPVEKPEGEKPTPTNFGVKEGKEKSSTLKYVRIALGIIIAIALFLLLRSCGENGPVSEPPLETTSTQATEGSTAATEQLVWSDWLDDLPEGITADKYDIEEKTLYSSRTQETTSSTEKNTMDGWELYNTVEANGEFGPWSDWSASKVDSSATREVDTQIRYRYRDKETTSSTSSTKEGWTYYASEDNYSYGAWSEWSKNVISPSGSTEVEERVYQWDYICDYYENGVLTDSGRCYPRTTNSGKRVGDVLLEYQNPGSPKVTLIITDIEYWKEYRSRTVTKEPSTYYFYRWGNWSNWSTDKVSSSSDRQVENTTFYRYRDRAKDITYYFRRWTEWSSYSETAVNPSDSVEVRTKVQYRYKSKES